MKRILAVFDGKQARAAENAATQQVRGEMNWTKQLLAHWQGNKPIVEITAGRPTETARKGRVKWHPNNGRQ